MTSTGPACTFDLARYRVAPGSSFFGSITLAQEVGDNDDDYEKDRPDGGESGWTAWRYSITYDRLFAGEYLFHAGFSGQFTDALLISGEQFGVGGVGTLRGFEERSVTGDSGYQLSLEVWFPPIGAYNLRFLYSFGALTLNDGGEMVRTDGIIHTIKGGVVVNNDALMEEVARMVAESKVGIDPDVMTAPFVVRR